MSGSTLNPEELELAVESGSVSSHRRQIPLRSTCAQPHHCPKPMRMRILAQIPLFAGLSEDELDGIDKRMVSLSWAEGDQLYTAGEPADHLYVLAAGQAKAFQPSPNGQDTIVDVLAPGDLFGGLSVLGRPSYAETAEALVTTCALRIDTSVFREVLLEHPQVALRVLDDVTALLVEARSDASQNAASTVAQRVGTTLLGLADKFGQHGASGSGTLIQLPLSRADLASMTGSTPESVSRVMSQLRKDGIIDSGRRWTSILDRERLAAMVASDA
ncbi:Crp/Fnr family transcriptional regulator [Microbacterium profundi]|uniref:Crp/Fnr family transcriptional regulator n=1 Tax=Microbacterium profundi TaxID=450380 RepID=UPI0027E08413|nr:Crp/Fnr family transcriptional regulator [Microbacterium profundi]MCE7483373.1 Crp/Fnr family transcriptional regulator [Microbacterium profundi]